MRRALLVGLGVFWFGGHAHAQLVWSEVTTLPGRNPALSAAPAGGVHVVLSDGSLRHVQIDVSGSVTVDELVPNTDSAAASFEFGPAVSVRDDVVHVAFARDVGSSLLTGHYVAKTSNGWSNVLDLQPAVERGYAPAIAADSAGAAHVLLGQATSVPFGVANYNRVNANAVDQSHPALVEWRVDDRSAIVAGPNGQIHAFGGYPSPNGQIYVSFSNDGGTTFSAQTEIQPANVGTARVGQPHAFADSSGTVHLVYGAGEEASDCANCAVHYAVIDQGNVQSTSVVTPAGVLDIWHLSLGIARIGVRADGTRVVTWQAHAGDDSAAPVSSSTSADGLSWTPPQAVADDCGGSEGRNTIDLVASDSTLWLACPKGSSTRIFRGVQGSGVPCNPADPFSGVSVTPASGSGPEAAFVAHYSHCEGADAFRVVQLRVTNVVDAAEPAVALGFENGQFDLDGQPCTPGEATELSSTYGSLDCANSSVTTNGNELVATFAVSFDTFTFAGGRGLFVDAKGGSVTPEPRLGWTEVGSWNVQTEAGGGGTSGLGGSGGGDPARGSVVEDSGCGCRVGARASSHGLVWLLLAALLRRAFRRELPALRSNLG
jgi:hypothetical protein